MPAFSEEQALQLPRSFVLGGDPPKAYLAGKELAKLPWRPLLEVSLMLGLIFHFTKKKLGGWEDLLKEYVVS